jgi:glutamine synthetase
MNGKLKLKDFLEKVENKEIKYVTVYFPSVHSANAKRYEAHYFVNEVLTGKSKIIDCIFGTNFDNGMVKNNTVKWDTGYQDNKFLIDEETFRIQSWLGNDYVLCMSKYLNSNNELHNFSTRNILIKTIEKFGKNQLNLFSASELEFYIFPTKNKDIVKEYPEINLKKHMLTTRSEYCMGLKMDEMEDLTRKLKDSIMECGIELEGLFNEDGPGQHEVNIRYSEVLNNCDNHIILKECIKHVCFVNNYGCTFMAKPFADRSGSSFHVHLSLYDKQSGRNIFAPTEKDFVEIKEHNMKVSNNLIYFVGGVLKYMPELFLIYAPYINSYKRYKKGTFAPFFINTWSFENRFSTIRVIGKEENLRIEVRLAAADANPYLVNTAIFAAGFEGIRSRIEPPEISSGNVYNSKDRIAAPHNLEAAIKAFDDSAFAKKIFGVDFMEYLVNFSKHELYSYEDHISNYEINRYLDIV